MSDKNAYYCVGRGREFARQAFYMSYNPMHKNGLLPYSKKFIKDYVYDRDGETPDMDRFQNILMQMDIPYIDKIIKSFKSGDMVGQYFQQFNAFPHYRGLTWKDSEFEYDESDEFEFAPEGFTATPAIKQFWGSGFTDDEYQFLEDELYEYMNSYECDTPAMKSLLQQAAYESLEIRRKRERRESASGNLKTLQDIFTSTNIKPVQETGTNASEQATFGTLIKQWENDKPIPEPLPEWKDKDVIKYVKTWFLGHLTRMVGLDNPFKKDYDDEIKKHTIDVEEEDGGSNG